MNSTDSSSASAISAKLPTEWIDAATGHRIIRLSREAGSQSLYFHQNAYTPNGQKLIFTAPGGIFSVDLASRAIHQIVAGAVQIIVVGRVSGEIYYLRNRTVCVANSETGAEREVAVLPPGASVATLNCDETLLAGTLTQGGIDRARDNAIPANAPQIGPDGAPLSFAEGRERMLDARLEQRLPMSLFTLDTRTGAGSDGALQTFYSSTDWLNHLQFSPTDPALLMFCHEGPWHKVDRLWTIRTDGGAPTKIHARTMNMEIAGHEFFGADGQTIWYDLQTPRGHSFWLAGVDLGSGERTRYHLERNSWGVHFNVSLDGKLFASDGGDSEMVAGAPDGKWISLLRPQSVPDVAGISAPDAGDLIRAGGFETERLVDMSRHDYRLEPNVTFTPDGKWIVFRSNLLGPIHVFAVEIEVPV